MPSAAYLNPTVYENLSGMDLNVYLVSHIFADGKFMAIFSMLFGASIIMLSNKARREHVNSGDLQRRRFFWLLILGLIHAYFIWYGDILVPYAICGFVMFVFRRRKTKGLFTAGVVFLAIGSAISLIIGYTIPLWEPGELQNATQEYWQPSSEAIAQEIEFYRGSWERQILYRAGQAFEMETRVFITSTFWRVSGLILLGMGFYRKRVFKAKQSKKYYTKMIVYGFGVGLPLVAAETYLHFTTDWKFELSFFFISQLNYWGSILMAIGYIGVIMYIMKSARSGFLSTALARTGQMALTNYLLQSIIATYIFYGHGMGMFGDLDRAAQAFAVLIIWVFLLVFSSFWLGYFKYGPFEWLWRSLSYGKIQPLAR